MNNPFSVLEIRFQTAQAIPPPYAHFYTLQLIPGANDSVEVDFSLTYTDRDEIDEDEIISEGFTNQDDYCWVGQLALPWLSVVKDLVARTTFHPVDEEALRSNDDFFVLRIGSDELEKDGMPTPINDWVYLAQELMQAIYETAGKERPFELAYIQNRPLHTTELQLTAFFSRREIRVHVLKDGKSTELGIPWKELNTLIEPLFSVDYPVEKTLTVTPAQEGEFVNVGGEGWYELNRIAGSKALRQFKAQLDKFLLI